MKLNRKATLRSPIHSTSEFTKEAFSDDFCKIERIPSHNDTYSYRSWRKSMPTGSSRLDGGRRFRTCNSNCCCSDSERGSVLRASPRMTSRVSLQEVSLDGVPLCSGLLIANRRCILYASWIICFSPLALEVSSHAQHFHTNKHALHNYTNDLCGTGP